MEPRPRLRASEPLPAAGRVAYEDERRGQERTAQSGADAATGGAGGGIDRSRQSAVFGRVKRGLSGAPQHWRPDSGRRTYQGERGPFLATDRRDGQNGRQRRPVERDRDGEQGESDAG